MERNGRLDMSEPFLTREEALTTRTDKHGWKERIIPSAANLSGRAVVRIIREEEPKR